MDQTINRQLFQGPHMFIGLFRGASDSEGELIQWEGRWPLRLSSHIYAALDKHFTVLCNEWVPESSRCILIGSFSVT